MSFVHIGPQGDADPEIEAVRSALRNSENGGGGEFIEVSRRAEARS
jgi:hypothetical protein